MDTHNSNGIIDPRIYLPYGSEIKSKQAMECIAIPNGIGPVLGFDVVRKSSDPTKLILTGSNQISGDILQDELQKRVAAAGGYKTCYVSVNNSSGRVVNSHFTPDSMLSIDPKELTLNIIGADGVINWDSLSENTNFIIAVKAKHDWVGSKEENPAVPSIDNFTAIKLSNTRTLRQLLKMNFNEVNTFLNQSFGSTFVDPNNEVLIGLYLFGGGGDTSDSQVVELMKSIGYVLPLIPYNYQWPPKYGYNLGTHLELKDYVDSQVKDLKQDVIEIKEKLPIKKNDGNIEEGAITPNLLEDNFDLPKGTTGFTEPTNINGVPPDSDLLATVGYVANYVRENKPTIPEVKLPWPYNEGWIKVIGELRFRRNPSNRNQFIIDSNNIVSDSRDPYVTQLIKNFNTPTIRVVENKLYGDYTVAYEATIMGNYVVTNGINLQILYQGITCSLGGNSSSNLYGRPNNQTSSGDLLASGYTPISVGLKPVLSQPTGGNQSLNLYFYVSWPPVNNENTADNCLVIDVSIQYSFFCRFI